MNSEWFDGVFHGGLGCCGWFHGGFMMSSKWTSVRSFSSFLPVFYCIILGVTWRTLPSQGTRLERIGFMSTASFHEST